MAHLSINPNSTKDFHLPNDDATTFHLGVFDIATRIYVSTFGANPNDPEPNHMYAYVEAIRFGLKGWTGVKGKDDTEVEFKTETVYIPKLGKREVVAKHLMDNMPIDWILKFGSELIAMNFPSEQDRKN